jgi:hypothetical protein
MPTCVIAILLGLISFTQAKAQVFWYNGDNNGIDSYFSSDSSAATPYVGIVYDDFTVGTSGTANITGIFGNYFFKDASTDSFLSNAVIGSANWEIRTGVSAGTAGTLVDSGTGAASVSTSLTPGGHTLYDISVTGLAVNLPAGTTYWVGLQPVTSSDAYGNLITTSGANAVGSPQGNDGEAYANDNFGDNYALITTNSTPEDFSLGVVGTVVPEPSTWALGMVGLGLFVLFRPRSNRT